MPERFKRLRIDHAWPRLPAQQLQNLLCRPRAHALAGLARDACGVIQADHVFKAKQRMIQRRRLLVPNVYSRSAKMATGQRVIKGDLVMQAATCSIDEYSPFAHRCESRDVHEVQGRSQSWAMQRNYITVL
ncbi:hypothetical protein D9M73_175170 [compost metagenome]